LDATSGQICGVGQPQAFVAAGRLPDDFDRGDALEHGEKRVTIGLVIVCDEYARFFPDPLDFENMPQCQLGGT